MPIRFDGKFFCNYLIDKPLTNILIIFYKKILTQNERKNKFSPEKRKKVFPHTPFQRKRKVTPFNKKESNYYLRLSPNKKKHRVNSQCFILF